ncbi:putative oxidoreductase [Rhizobium sp. BK312]|uniref:SDR family NAD(P)-dependent oxidoreductase n=1 Tax=Rhizobium sp. BK312 TaxID=2587080 RepID=UPI000DD908A3|nr:SDR family NAD(P)-dependent oxidoreductase [Rhizobium sp. BK312]MBB3427954.1 putative oxidoreductase [Rhizobium sp. BK312]
MQFKGQKFLVTGGAGGIGLALARGLIDAGSQVVICGRSQESLDTACQQVPSLIARRCDVSNPEDRASLIDWLQSEHSDLSGLVNNAAVQSRMNLAEGVPEHVVAAELQINFVAPLMLSLELLPILKRQKGQAVIVNISSGLAYCPVASMPIYSASKAALHSVTLSLRHQLAPEGVRVVEVVPPPVDTGLGDHSARDALAAGLPVLTPDAFVSETLARLGADEQEIIVGLSNASKEPGEALFAVFNRVLTTN